MHKLKWTTCHTTLLLLILLEVGKQQKFTLLYLQCKRVRLRQNPPHQRTIQSLLIAYTCPGIPTNQFSAETQTKVHEVPHHNWALRDFQGLALIGNEPKQPFSAHQTCLANGCMAWVIIGENSASLFPNVSVLTTDKMWFCSKINIIFFALLHQLWRLLLAITYLLKNS